MENASPLTWIGEALRTSISIRPSGVELSLAKYLSHTLGSAMASNIEQGLYTTFGLPRNVISIAKLRASSGASRSNSLVDGPSARVFA